MNRNKKIPIWLRRLDVVTAEMKSVRFPVTAEEGFRRCDALSKAANHLLLESIRNQGPRESDEAVERVHRLLMARLSAAESRHLKRWKKERDRFFRG